MKTKKKKIKNNEIKKAEEIARLIRENKGEPLKNYAGGSKYFNNGELPVGIKYKEYDVDPYILGKNRGAKRIVIGSNNTYYYTNDHYRNFIKLNI